MPVGSLTRLSTDGGDAIGAPASRGARPFDAAALKAALAEAPLGEPLKSEHVAEYLGFYGLGFADIPHRHEMFCIRGANERLVVQYYLPSDIRGHVFVCHGYYDHVGLFGYVIEYLMRCGMAVITYDQIGHGLSSGAPATIENFDRYVEATRAVWLHAQARFQPAGPWHWFGQSMGGAIVMEYLQQYPPAPRERDQAVEQQQAIGEIVLLAPLVRPYAWAINRWVFAVARYTIKHRRRTLTNNAENPEFHALQEIDPLQARTLPVAWVQAMVDWSARFVAYPVSQLAPKLVQGDDDHTVDWKFGLALYQRRYPNCQYLMVPGGRHHLANESAHKRAQMWAFLDENCHW